MEEKSLITKLYKKFCSICNNKSASVKKVMCSLLIASTILSPLTACVPENSNSTDLSKPPVTDNQDHSEYLDVKFSCDLSEISQISDSYPYALYEGYVDPALVQSGEISSEFYSFFESTDSNKLIILAHLTCPNEDGTENQLFIKGTYPLTDKQKSDYIEMCEEGSAKALLLNKIISLGITPASIESLLLDTITIETFSNSLKQNQDAISTHFGYESKVNIKGFVSSVNTDENGLDTFTIFTHEPYADSNPWNKQIMYQTFAGNFTDASDSSGLISGNFDIKHFTPNEELHSEKIETTLYNWNLFPIEFEKTVE